jgi:hypothetical protein
VTVCDLVRGDFFKAELKDIALEGKAARKAAVLSSGEIVKGSVVVVTLVGSGFSPTVQTGFANRFHRCLCVVGLKDTVSRVLAQR